MDMRPDLAAKSNPCCSLAISQRSLADFRSQDRPSSSSPGTQDSASSSKTVHRRPALLQSAVMVQGFLSLHAASGFGPRLWNPSFAQTARKAAVIGLSQWQWVGCFDWLHRQPRLQHQRVAHLQHVAAKDQPFRLCKVAVPSS
jgi:hypothetical protein